MREGPWCIKPEIKYRCIKGTHELRKEGNRKYRNQGIQLEQTEGLISGCFVVIVLEIVKERYVSAVC